MAGRMINAWDARLLSNYSHPVLRRLVVSCCENARMSYWWGLLRRGSPIVVTCLSAGLGVALYVSATSTFDVSGPGSDGLVPNIALFSKTADDVVDVDVSVLEEDGEIALHVDESSPPAAFAVPRALVAEGLGIGGECPDTWDDHVVVCSEEWLYVAVERRVEFPASSALFADAGGTHVVHTPGLDTGSPAEVLELKEALDLPQARSASPASAVQLTVVFSQRGVPTFLPEPFRPSLSQNTASRAFPNGAVFTVEPDPSRTTLLVWESIVSYDVPAEAAGREREVLLAGVLLGVAAAGLFTLAQQWSNRDDRR